MLLFAKPRNVKSYENYENYENFDKFTEILINLQEKLHFSLFQFSGAPKGPRNDCLQAHPGVVARKSAKSVDFSGFLTFLRKSSEILTFSDSSAPPRPDVYRSNEKCSLSEPQKRKKC